MRIAHLMVVPLVGLVAACGGKDEGAEAPATMTERATAAAVSAATGLDVSVKDLPDFVVVPKDAKVISRMNLGNDEQRGGAVSLESGQTPAELLAFYRGVMADKGLKIAMENVSTDSVLLVGNDEAETRMLNVAIAPGEDGKTSVTLIHTTKAAGKAAG